MADSQLIADALSTSHARRENLWSQGCSSQPTGCKQNILSCNNSWTPSATKKTQQLANIRKATRAWELMGKPFMRAQCDLTAVADVCRGGSHVSADSQESIQDAVLTPLCVTEVREAALVYCRRGWGWEGGGRGLHKLTLRLPIITQPATGREY